MQRGEVGDAVLVEHDDITIDYEMLLVHSQCAVTISGKSCAQS